MNKVLMRAILVLGIVLLVGGTLAYFISRSGGEIGRSLSEIAPGVAGISRLTLGARVQVEAIAGSARSGQQDGAAAQAGFADPYGIVVDQVGNVFVADAGENNRIRKISPQGVVSTFAGSSEGFANGLAQQAKFHTPSALAIDASGNLYVADSGNHAIRKITPQGQVSTVAGTGVAGSRDGPAAQAQFNAPLGVALDKEGNVYVADTYNDKIRVIRSDGTVHTLAGGAQAGYQDGTGAGALFDTPSALLLNDSGELIVADTYNHAIRKINAQGVVTTLTRSQPAERKAWLRRPQGLALSTDGVLYVSETINGRVLQITPNGEVHGLHGIDVDIRVGDADTPRLIAPTALAFDPQGTLFVADQDALQIRRLSLHDPNRPIARSSIPAFATRNGKTPWPIAPQNRPHEVVGTMGEVRGNHDGENRDHFHGGLDIQAPMGSSVLVSIAEKVKRVIPSWAYEDLSEGIRLDSLSYVHLKVGRKADNSLYDPNRFQLITPLNGKARMRIKRGTRFQVGEPIGSVNKMYHVHLEFSPAGNLENPLELSFIGLQDSIAPTIEEIEVQDSQGKVIAKGKDKLVHLPRTAGKVGIVVYAFDQMDGNTKNRRLGLYQLGYQILRANGKPVPGFEQVLMNQRYDRLPLDDEMVKLLYAENSGITVYGSKRTSFGYLATNSLRDGVAKAGAWQIDQLPPGDYLIRITALDFAGNQAGNGRDLAVRIE